MAVKLPGMGVMRSMLTTLRATRQPEITIQYPEEKPHIPERFRGRIIWEREICTGCLACERACPEEVILIDTHRDPALKGGLFVDNFVLNFGLCSWCGLCVDVCPTKPVKSIRFGHDYEFSSYTREGLIYANERLYPPDDQMTPEEVMPHIQPDEWTPNPKHLQHGPEDLGLERYSMLVAKGLINPDNLATPPAAAQAAPVARAAAPAAVPAAAAPAAPAAVPAGAPPAGETVAEKRARLLAEGAARKAALDAQKGGAAEAAPASPAPSAAAEAPAAAQPVAEAPAAAEAAPAPGASSLKERRAQLLAEGAARLAALEAEKKGGG